MHGVLAMAGRDEISRKALEEEKGRLITQLGYEQVRIKSTHTRAFECFAEMISLFVQGLKRMVTEKMDKEAQQHRLEIQQLHEQLELALKLNSGDFFHIM
jgi:hypothetical protein